MKPYDNDEELALQIGEQETALTELLARVMQAPLAPLRETLDQLQERLTAVEDLNTEVINVSLPALQAELEEARTDITRSVRTGLRSLSDMVEGIQSRLIAMSTAFDQEGARQAAHGQRISEELSQSHSALISLAAKADTTDDAIAQLAAHTDTTRNNVEVVMTGNARLEQEIGVVLEHARDLSGNLSQQFNALTAYMESRHANLGERLGLLEPEISKRINGLTETMDKTTGEIVRSCERLSETQSAVIATAVQKELASQLHPLQRRTRWMASLCGLSLVTTFVLLAMLLTRQIS